VKLRELLERVNLPDLIARERGGEAVHGLTRERGGAICDPRPGCEEHHPSFSVYRVGQVWRWKRHGGDGEGGSAFDLLLAFGYSEIQAREELHRLAGVALDALAPCRVRPALAAPDPLTEARALLARCVPLDEKEARRARGLLAPLRGGDGAACELLARGLHGWAGLECGKLRRDFTTPDGRQLAHVGALGFFLRGPDGQPWGLKVRNAGTADGLRAAGLNRYLYRLGRHGAPAWCSPGYGSGDGVLLVEGELNGAAAARGLEAVGARLDVQGLAGAGGTPFLDGLAGRPVYLYADPDTAGVACLERVGRLARAAGAHEVRVLASLPAGDFCDLAGGEGVAALSARLLDLLGTSTNHHTISPTGEKTQGQRSTFSPPHQTPRSGVVVKVAPEELALKKYRAKLAKFGGGL